MQIWVVDDNKADLILFEENLLELGYRSRNISCFEDLTQLDEALSKANPDILFLDLFLPGSMGIETFEHVMRLNPKCPIVVLSGVRDMDTALRTVQMGAQDFLIKDEMTSEGIFRMIGYSTERYRNISALRESEEKYRALFQSIPIGTIVLDENLVIIEANEEAQNYLKRNYLIGMPYLTAIADFGKTEQVKEALINCSTRMLKQNHSDEIVYIEQSTSRLLIGDEFRFIVSLIDRTEKVLRDIKKNEIVHNTLDKERLRISRELHDGIGQYLVAVQLQLELLKGINDETDDSIEKIQELTKTTISLARSMSYSLSPPDLDKGLLTAVETLFIQLQNLKSITFDLNCKGGKTSPFNKIDEYSVFRIVQEFVNNSIKYSKCDLISCTIEFGEDFARIELYDNGEGFDLNNASLGLGLRTMKERAQASEIEYNLFSAPGEGTKLKLEYIRNY